MIVAKLVSTHADSLTVMVSDEGNPVGVFKITVGTMGGVSIETQFGQEDGKLDFEMLQALLRVMSTHVRLRGKEIKSLADIFRDYVGNQIGIEISEEAIKGL